MSRIFLLQPTKTLNLQSISCHFHIKHPIHHHHLPRNSLRPFFSSPSPPPPPLLPKKPHKNHKFTIRALSSSPVKDEEDKTDGKTSNYSYPTGDFVMMEFDWFSKFVLKVKLLLAFPWERVKKGSVLSIKLKGEISEQLATRFSSSPSLPQICQNITKATYDPRISGIYLQIDPLSCGWGKVEEIRRHILDFKNHSGKFIVAYINICSEKEYYLACACNEVYMPPSAYIGLYGLTVQSSFLGGVLERIGVEPQIMRIGNYKSAGDQLSRKTMSAEVCEMLTALLDNTYSNWLDVVSFTHGKDRKEIEEFINTGVYEVERLKKEGWITDMLYDDEVQSKLKERLGQKDEAKSLLVVENKKYSRVRNSTLGLEGRGDDQIAVIRASGNISRARGPLSVSNSGIVSDQLIEKIRSIRESGRYKKVKAVILRIDSPGGDALASDLMWREIKLLSAVKPVIASMSDVAASGGYYMAMAADAIVAENLTLTGSIGVVTGKFSLSKLYERIGFNKELISRGKYAELFAADNRSFKPEEREIFEKSARSAYEKFRDKAAASRSMTVEGMEAVAQGRVWSGKDAAERGLVDAVGGFSLALAIAKQKAGIAGDERVRLVEISKPSPSFFQVVSGIGSSVLSVREVIDSFGCDSGVQARMDGILFERLGSGLDSNPVFQLARDFLRLF